MQSIIDNFVCGMVRMNRKSFRVSHCTIMKNGTIYRGYYLQSSREVMPKNQVGVRNKLEIGPFSSENAAWEFYETKISNSCAKVLSLKKF